MNKYTAQGNLNTIKSQIQKKWGQLTDQDFERAAGQKDEIIGLIQKKYGETEEAIEKYLSELLSKVEENGEVALRNLAEKKDEIVHYAETVTESLKDEIKKNPISSVLIGLGIGYLLGKLSK